jgi:hypothetical protein
VKTQKILMAILLGAMALCGQMTAARADWAPGDWVEGTPKWWWKYVYPGGRLEGGLGPTWLKMVELRMVGQQVLPSGAPGYAMELKMQNRSTQDYRGGDTLHIKGFCDPSPQPWRMFDIVRFTLPALKKTEVYTARFVIPAPPRLDWSPYLLELALNDVDALKRLFGCFDLEGSTNLAQTMQLQFLLADGSVGFTTQMRLNSEGRFLLPALPAGFAKIAIKGDKWLQKVIPGDFDPETPLLLKLPAGDTNNDNSIDVLDLDAIIRSFDTQRGDTGYIQDTDLNCDGSIDVLDMDLVIRNFDTVGDA